MRNGVRVLASLALIAATAMPAVAATPAASPKPSGTRGATPTPTPKPTPSPAPTVGAVETFWGFATAVLTFDSTHSDRANGAWAVRAFVETDSDGAVFATLVEGPASHPHATLYARPVTYGGRKGIVISVALLGKDPTKSDALATGEHVVVRVLQRRARSFKPPLQYRGETQ